MSPNNIDTSTMIAGAIAGSLARVPTHPLDTLKARWQSVLTTTSNANSSYNQKLGSRLVNSLIQIYQIEGLRGLYRGFLFTATWSAPASCLYYTTYETVRKQQWFAKDTPLSHLTAGFIAETVSCVLWVPIDVIKERMQVEPAQSTRYKSGLQGAIRIWQSKDGIQGLYKGYFATLASFGPFSALYFMFYEQLRSFTVSTVTTTHSTTNQPLPPLVYAGLAAISGSFAAFLTNPLDLVKLRLQVNENTSEPRKGMIYGLRLVLRNEGIQGLFKGAVPRSVFSGAATAVNMTIFEKVRWFIEGKDRVE
jgi:hypothetical protein